MADYSNETTPPVTAESEAEALRQQRRIVITVAIAGVIFITLIVLAVIFLLRPGTPTETIRDIFIIFVALESLIVGAALIILIIQIASLINLLQNEVRPILSATNETVNTLRGTTEFLSENVVEPVIKLNSYLAGLQKLLNLVGLKKR